MPDQATELAAFLAAALAGLAAGVYLLVLHLFLRKAPLPPCAPDQRICAETFNLLLVLCALGHPLLPLDRPPALASCSQHQKATEHCCIARSAYSRHALCVPWCCLIPMQMQRYAMLSPPCPSRAPVPHSSTHAVQPVEQAGQAP